MKRLLFCIVAAALSACAPESHSTDPAERSPVVAAERPMASPVPSQSQATAPPSPATAAPAEAAGTTLPVGEYRLAGADGRAIDLGHAITVSVTEREIRLASQCVTPRWTYRIEGGRMVTEPVAEPICDRGRYPAEMAASAVFGSPQQVEKTEANGWRISGGGHSITLFSQ